MSGDYNTSQAILPQEVKNLKNPFRLIHENISDTRSKVIKSKENSTEQK